MKPQENELPPQKTPTPDCCGVMRMNGRAVISDVIHRLRRRADYLQMLSDMLPANPTAEQDEALWQVACELERR